MNQPLPEKPEDDGERTAIPEWPPDVFRQKPAPDRISVHLALFLATLISTTLSYSLWVGFGIEEWSDLFSSQFLSQAVWFSIPLLLFLTVHEFGHYIAARIHRVDASLPYYIPLPFLGIGTLGAVIRIRQPIPSLQKLFDIGVAGPLAGFVAVFVMLLVAFATLPDVDHVNSFVGHDSLKIYVNEHGAWPDELIWEEGAEAGTVPVVGETLLYSFVAGFFENAPPMYEMYHYPFLFACWLGLFFTALNLLPVGQLDGGHVLFAMVGPVWHSRIARSFVMLLLVSGSIGVVKIPPEMFGAYELWRWPGLVLVLYIVLKKTFAGEHGSIAPALVVIYAIAFVAGRYIPGLGAIGYSGWLIWSFLIAFVLRVEHPPVLYSEPLTPGQRYLAITALVIFVLCFSVRPFYYL